jgi:hypothetical protein
MTSPRHLWSGDWRRDSNAAASELAKRRAQSGAPEDAAGESAAATRPVRGSDPGRRAEAFRRPEPVRPEPVRPPEPIRRAEPVRAPDPVRAPGFVRATDTVRRPEPHPDREPLLDRAGAALKRGLESLQRIPPPNKRERRAILLIALAAVVVAGAAYGLAQIGGSGGSSDSIATTGRPWLGVELSQPPGGGVIVGRVFAGGPSGRAGIQPGDVIMAVGNQPVSSPADVQSAIENLQPGDQIPLTVLRGANSYTTLVRLAGQPAGTP